MIRLFRQAARQKWTSRVTKKRVRDILASRDAIRIEIGAWKKRPGISLITIDQDQRADLAQGLPFPDNSVSLIYTSHLLEHLSFWEIELLLRDCLRALKPGGRLSICVPNARLYVEAYFNGTIFPPPGRQYEPGISDTNSAIDKMNYIAYMRGHHKYMFDEENLVKLLAQCGFAAPRLRDFDPQVDIAARDFESIYALATKCDHALSSSTVGLNS